VLELRFDVLCSADKCLVPVTIKQINGCKQDSPDDAIKIDGREASQITLVAQILNVAESSTFVAYTLEDGTGQLSVNFWIEQVFPSDTVEIEDSIRQIRRTIGLIGRLSFRCSRTKASMRCRLE
jgi:replication factor A2